MKDIKFNPNIKKVVCRNVKKFRKEKKLSSNELADLVEVSPEYLRRIEAPNDEDYISIVVLYKIAKVLDVDICEFFGEKHKSEK